MCSVLIVDLSKHYGGSEVRVLDTARLLHERYPYAVATLAGSPLHQRLEAAKLVALPVPFSRGDPRIIPFLVRSIRQHGYKAVDAHNVHSQFWGHLAAVLTGSMRKVSTVHSSYKAEHNGSPKGWAYEQVLRLNGWLGTQFIVVSEAVQAYLVSLGIPQNKISLIHNSFQAVASLPRERNHPVLNALGWDKDAYIVIVVARLEPVKGHTYLIEAVGRVAKERPQLRCLIVGDGRTRTMLEEQTNQLALQEQIHFTGFRDDIPALLRASDVFCLPSLSEALPYALLEACAHRLPLLVTRVGGMAELLTHKSTAFLVPPSDPGALAEGLCWLMDHPAEAKTMGRAAFDWFQERFSPEEMIAKTLAVYECRG